MENSETIQRFLSYLETRRHLSLSTVRVYNQDLVQFDKFLAGASFLSVNANTIKAYFALMGENQYVSATICRKIAAIRSFYKFLVADRMVSFNPVSGIKAPKVEKKQPHFLGYEEAKKLFEAIRIDTWLGARDKAILELLYDTGIRVAELAVLNTDDIDFLGQVVHIRKNGQKEKILAISPSAFQIIQHYVELRNKKAQSNPKFDASALFINKNGGRISTRSISRKMGKYVKISELNKRATPTTLRYSFLAKHTS